MIITQLRDKDFCERLYVKEGKTTQEIAKIVHCESTAVGYWLKKHNILLRKSGRIALDYKGKRFGNLVAIESFSDGHSKIWKCECDCGNICNVSASNLKKGTKYCWSCRNKYLSEIKWCGHGEICLDLWTSIKRSAQNRKKDFDISIEDMWDLFIKQDRKCALSGVDLFFSRTIKARPASTASLDRIDSSKGYIKGNIQWIHKDLNIMKMDLSQKDFISWCKIIAEKYKDNTDY